MIQLTSFKIKIKVWEFWLFLSADFSKWKNHHQKFLWRALFCLFCKEEVHTVAWRSAEAERIDKEGWEEENGRARAGRPEGKKTMIAERHFLASEISWHRSWTGRKEGRSVLDSLAESNTLRKSVREKTEELGDLDKADFRECGCLELKWKLLCNCQNQAPSPPPELPSQQPQPDHPYDVGAPPPELTPAAAGIGFSVGLWTFVWQGSPYLLWQYLF